MKFVISVLVCSVIAFSAKVICSDVKQATHQGRLEPAIHLYNEVFVMDIQNYDPIQFDLVEWNYAGEMTSASLNISQASISGFSEYNLLELEFSKTEPAFTFHIVFPRINLYAEHYEFDGHIFYVIPMKGQGIAHFEVYDLQLKGTIYMKKSESSSSVVIDKFEEAELNIKRIVSRTEFDHNIDNIISAIVEDMLAGYINRFNKYFLFTYHEIIVQYINDILEKFVMNHLIN